VPSYAEALADGETKPAALAALADQRFAAHTAQLCDALGACAELSPVYRRLLKMALEELRLIDEQIGELDKEMASLLSQHQDAVDGWRRCPVWEWTQRSRSLPKSAHLSDLSLRKCLSSWVGACPVTTRAQA